eukprot:jgi/Mesvir1/24388/Mv11057-RA.2
MQVGAEFLHTLATEGEEAGGEYKQVTHEQFFREVSTADGRTLLQARAVLVDMEPKVVAAARKRAVVNSGGLWCYGSNNFFSEQSGSGNNWARGYVSLGQACREHVMAIVRREVEACDHMGGFLLLQSMAGGTGAGLGTHLTEELRDEYPSSLMANVCFWPYSSGEVIVQNYNTLLSLAHLQQASDAVMLMENDTLHRVCHTLLGIERPSFNEMNDVAARAAACALLPSVKRFLGGGAGGDRCPDDVLRPPPSPGATRPLRGLADIVSHLTPHPGLKLVTLRSTPQIPPRSIDFTTFSWAPLLKRVRQMLITGASVEEGMDWNRPAPPVRTRTPEAPQPRDPGSRCLANLVVLRGKDAQSLNLAPLADLRGLYPNWATDPLLVSTSPACFSKYETAAAILSNGGSVLRPMEDVAGRTYRMLASRAYLHQYEQHGLQLEDFEEALAGVEDTIARYRML